MNRLKFLNGYFTIVIVTSLLLNFGTTAPASDKQEIKEKKVDEITSDPCEFNELNSFLECKDNDQDCELKNEKRRLKRQTICDEYPSCSYCSNESPNPIDLPNYDEESLIVEPEIVGVFGQPVELTNNSVPVDGTIVINASKEQLIDQSNIDELTPRRIIERNIVVENENEKHYYRGYVDSASNVTTIIRLTNLINNTNVVNMPTTLNNTNINNIHVYNNKSSTNGGKFGLGYTEDGPCCYAMKPGVCKQTTSGLKCRHRKTRVCGKQCTKKLIHTQRSFCNRVPQWPYMICPQMMPQYPYYPIPQFPPQFEYEFDDDDDLPIYPTDDELENEESDWIVFQEKCKIVSEDGLKITNCTQKNIEFEHPYAKNSVDNVSKRSVRHVKRDQMNTQQNHEKFNPYQYPMMQPIYFQPIPIYMPSPMMYPVMPQYYQSNAPMYPYYPQQIPVPPIDTENYYDDPIIDTRDDNPYKNTRKHAKKHSIVIEHDDEL